MTKGEAMISLHKIEVDQWDFFLGGGKGGQNTIRFRNSRIIIPFFFLIFSYWELIENIKRMIAKTQTTLYSGISYPRSTSHNFITTF